MVWSFLTREDTTLSVSPLSVAPLGCAARNTGTGKATDVPAESVEVVWGVGADRVPLVTGTRLPATVRMLSVARAVGWSVTGGVAPVVVCRVCM